MLVCEARSTLAHRRVIVCDVRTSAAFFWTGFLICVAFFLRFRPPHSVSLVDKLL